MRFKKGHIYSEKNSNTREKSILFLFLDDNCSIKGIASISPYCYNERNPLGDFTIDTKYYIYRDLTPELK